MSVLWIPACARNDKEHVQTKLKLALAGTPAFAAVRLAGGDKRSAGTPTQQKEKTMNEENPANIPEKPRRKKTSTLLVFALCFCTGLILAHSLPLSTMPVSGTVVILNEAGDAIPFQPIKATYFSHYAIEFFWSDRRRKSRVNVNQSGAFRVRRPNFNGTLFLETNDGKYATVVDIRSDEPATGLDVVLRPRYSVTGRLLNDEGKPLANQEISLILQRSTDNRKWWLPGDLFSRARTIGLIEEFHKERTTTDTEGYFTMERLIPGVEYRLYTHYPHSGRFRMPLEIPILQPEQYAEPYSLGDIVVPRQ